MALTAERTSTVAPTKPLRVRPRPLPELVLVTLLFMAYKIGRIVADDHVHRAFANADRVWHVERWAHLPSEVAVQHALLSSDALIRGANVYYACVHFPATIAFLLWIYLARPGAYVPLRRMMTGVTMVALATHIAFPLAPPRMLPGFGLIDTAARYGPSVYGPPSTDTLSNQYAAMPSLHVGWALIIAIGMIVTSRSRWRWLWLAYPATTFTVVLGTANHYWLDGFVAIVIVCAFLPLVIVRRPVVERMPVVAVVPVAEVVRSGHMARRPVVIPRQRIRRHAGPARVATCAGRSPAPRRPRTR